METDGDDEMTKQTHQIQYDIAFIEAMGLIEEIIAEAGNNYAKHLRLHLRLKGLLADALSTPNVEVTPYGEI